MTPITRHVELIRIGRPEKAGCRRQKRPWQVRKEHC